MLSRISTFAFFVFVSVITGSLLLVRYWEIRAGEGPLQTMLFEDSWLSTRAWASVMELDKWVGDNAALSMCHILLGAPILIIGCFVFFRGLGVSTFASTHVPVDLIQGGRVVSQRFKVSSSQPVAVGGLLSMVIGLTIMGTGFWPLLVSGLVDRLAMP